MTSVAVHVTVVHVLGLEVVNVLGQHNEAAWLNIWGAMGVAVHTALHPMILLRTHHHHFTNRRVLAGSCTIEVANASLSIHPYHSICRRLYLCNAFCARSDTQRIQRESPEPTTYTNRRDAEYNPTTDSVTNNVGVIVLEIWSCGANWAIVSSSVLMGLR